MLTIAIGTDHRGFKIKEFLLGLEHIAHKKIKWLDVGTFQDVRTDYPLFGFPVCELIRDKQADKGILLCGTGVGMSIVANRFSHIYAALAWNEEVARRSKEEDNANILVLPADYLSQEAAYKCILAWICAEFKEERYAERLRLVNNIK